MNVPRRGGGAGLERAAEDAAENIPRLRLAERAGRVPHAAHDIEEGEAGILHADCRQVEAAVAAAAELEDIVARPFTNSVPDPKL
jgi:hypothetical protein